VEGIGIVALRNALVRSDLSTELPNLVSTRIGGQLLEKIQIVLPLICTTMFDDDNNDDHYLLRNRTLPIWIGELIDYFSGLNVSFRFGHFVDNR
jgi:hypothetical protein